MTACPTCGAPQAQRRRRGALVTQASPRGAWWQDRPLALTPSEHAILHKLCAGDLLHGHGTSPVALRNHVSHLRAKLPAGVGIKVIDSMGYRLTIKEQSA